MSAESTEPIETGHGGTKEGAAERLSIRAKAWITVGALIALEPLLFAAAGYLLSAADEQKGPTAESRLLLVMGALGLLVVTLQAILVALTDLMLLKPLGALDRGASIMRHTHAAHELEMPRIHLLGSLADHLHSLGAELHIARGALQGALLTGAAAEQIRRTRLEQIVRELHVGVVACDAQGRIQLYNDAALRNLDAHPALGLGRSLYRILDRAPIEHALGLLEGSGAHAADIQCAVKGAEIWLRCRLGPLRLEDGCGSQAPGFLLVLEDVTRRRRAVEVRDDLLRAALCGLRETLGELRDALRTPDRASPAGPASEERRNDVDTAVQALETRIDVLETDTRALAAAEWVSSDVYGGDLLRVIADRLLQRHRIRVSIVRASHWLRIDSHEVAQLIEHVVTRAGEFAGVREFEMATISADHGVDLEIRWEGAGVGASTASEWVAEALKRVPGGNILAGTLIQGEGKVGVVPPRPVVTLNLPASGTQDRNTDVRLPSRPEFYDFDLGAVPTDGKSRANCDLCKQDYVVFDTETTGLRPSQGDEIVSIAGVRIVNRQIIRGETFQQLVNPGRHIPRASVRFHGITDEQVANEPSITEVLKRFHEFVGDAVLVAYNAAFDMKFLHLKEAGAGVRFDNPVLDVLLLSVSLHDHVEDHTLDAIAARLGVDVIDRHTAIGDAMVTAATFLHMLDLLPRQGIRTLGEAMEVSLQAVDVRKQQDGF